MLMQTSDMPVLTSDTSMLTSDVRMLTSDADHVSEEPELILLGSPPPNGHHFTMGPLRASTGCNASSRVHAY